MREITIFLFLMTGGAVAQVKPPLPEFDAAVVKLNKSGAAEASGGILPGGEFSVRNISMIDLLGFAWHVDENSISGFQSWFRSDRFDVIGRAPANTPDATLRLMLQSLLTKEFRLKVHEEPKPQDAYALIVAKDGPKLQKTATPNMSAGASSRQVDDPEDQCKRTAVNGGVQADCISITMTQLAKQLPHLAPGYIDRPVVDLTGISGAWDLRLNWIGKGKIETEGGLTIFDSVTKQLGLRLEQRKIPLPGIAVDHAERLAEN